MLIDEQDREHLASHLYICADSAASRRSCTICRARWYLHHQVCKDPGLSLCRIIGRSESAFVKSTEFPDSSN